MCPLDDCCQKNRGRCWRGCGVGSRVRRGVQWCGAAGKVARPSETREDPSGPGDSDCTQRRNGNRHVDTHVRNSTAHNSRRWKRPECPSPGDGQTKRGPSARVPSLKKEGHPATSHHTDQPRDTTWREIGGSQKDRHWVIPPVGMLLNSQTREVGGRSPGAGGGTVQSHRSVSIELPFGPMWKVLETVNSSGHTIMQTHLMSLSYIYTYHGKVVSFTLCILL